MNGNFAKAYSSKLSSCFKVLLWALMLTITVVGVPEGTPGSQAVVGTVGKHVDNGLLKNIDTIQPKAAQLTNQKEISQWKADLPTLWNWDEDAQSPLALEIVYSTVANGVHTEGIYINGYGNSNGQDRLFFYYSRPEVSDIKRPLYIDLTGGGEAEHSTWMARTYQCAVIDIEWRGDKNKFRSKWARGEFGSMKAFGILKEHAVFRLIFGIRRAIDFAVQQPGTDVERLGCGGGSTGGYYALLLAGVDSRIRFGMDELGAGYQAQTDSNLGQFNLSQEEKALWIKAFDPYTYAPNTHARMLMNLAANDYFFWLGDGVKNFQALVGEKTLCITPNFNHTEGSYGTVKHDPMVWLSYAMGLELNYPVVTSFSSDGVVYRVCTQPGTDIEGATLYWSPGQHIVWPARYWLEIPTASKDGCWQAEIPARYAALERYAFMNVHDIRGRTASTVPVFSAGVDPQAIAGGWWPREQALDVATGLGAWRPVGPNEHLGTTPAGVARHAGGGIAITPNPENGGFSLVNNSLVLAYGVAKQQAGLRIELDAGDEPGELTVTLVRNFGAVQMQHEFSTVVRYGKGRQHIKVPWSAFKSNKNSDEPCFPFETLRLDGKRPGGKDLVLAKICLLEITDRKTPH